MAMFVAEETPSALESALLPLGLKLGRSGRTATPFLDRKYEDYSVFVLENSPPTLEPLPSTPSIVLPERLYISVLIHTPYPQSIEHLDPLSADLPTFQAARQQQPRQGGKRGAAGNLPLYPPETVHRIALVSLASQPRRFGGVCLAHPVGLTAAALRSNSSLSSFDVITTPFDPSNNRLITLRAPPAAWQVALYRSLDLSSIPACRSGPRHLSISSSLITKRPLLFNIRPLWIGGDNPGLESHVAPESAHQLGSRESHHNGCKDRHEADASVVTLPLALELDFTPPIAPNTVAKIFITSKPGIANVGLAITTQFRNNTDVNRLPNSTPRDSAIGPKHNWSPTSAILPFGGVSPKHLPLDSNPDFEAFRRQTEEVKGFSLGHGNLQYFASSPGPRLDHKPTRSDVKEHLPSPKVRHGAADGTEVDGGPSPGQAASGQMRSAVERSLSTSFFDLPRQESPAMISSPETREQRNMISSIENRHPRLSLPHNKADPPTPPDRQQNASAPHRAATLPSLLERGPAMISPSQLRDIMKRLPPSDFLLLDLRVSPQYATSRIEGALNLCIPTTLLKRPSFNLKKLQDTFTNDLEREKFSNWKTVKHIVVYDAYSSEKRDAVPAMNTLNKFFNEGWEGTSHLLRGGFREFAKCCPQQVDDRSTKGAQPSKINLSLGTSQSVAAPVAGGCMMPANKNPANPFFSNIRQNQDLIDGVGQMDVKLPESISESPEKYLPEWLVKATKKEDHGKRISDNFLRLELAEQARMNKALSGGVFYGAGATVAGSQGVQIAGVEEGGKNRYNNIWPFEHARVKLQGRPQGACDYVNASYIKASRSNKRYIASQGPLPATFDDFWSVVWDQDVRVIVMLTAEKEGGQVKCHPYWSSQDYGQLRLKSLSEKKVSLDPKQRRMSESRRDTSRRRANTTMESAPPAPASEIPYAIVRKFTLSHAAHPFTPMREITQVHYSSWPDFGAPANANQLLSLVELSNLMQHTAASPTQSPRSDDPELDQSPRPMLVHCSAGCGRTGTFCAIDSAIDMLKRQRKELTGGVTPMEVTSQSEGGDYLGKGKQVPGDSDWIFNQDIDLVEKTVEDFRGQRLSMVQSLRQYVLCYEAVVEWIAQQHVGHNSTRRERSGSDGGTMERRKSNS
ncbi:uncharacterized protein BP5553_02603 [Venustampulla echinocandica]|uniref:protein-tyrosine-phosphatase n=1 Tax=Venustampulla echinocandica TaxID=2656787 RepID=A0A370TRY9_9HELO|nr:uncharacterized protein BP5553_02603 [Venustampulla echinocandica]RDL38263.1 hypothetical protein BP5553_02603 [Venustampulla echinocandica]